MKSLDADGALVEGELDVLTLAEEVFFDEWDLVSIVNFLG